MDKFAGIILAAGQGLRMKSRIPKAMHRFCGKELVQYPVDIMKALGAPNIISKERQGRETWTYDRISQNSDAQSSGFYFLIFGSSRSSSSKSSKSLTAIITFDDNKSVVDFAYQSLEY